MRHKMSIFSDWFFIFGSQENDNPCQKEYTLSILTVLAYILAPMAGLMVILFKKEVLSSVRYFVDCFCLPAILVPFNKRCSIQEWARRRVPRSALSDSNTLSGVLSSFWIDGSLLCTIINTAIPGACTNPYSHWKKPPSHAQDVAQKYLGIKPVFTKSEFSSKISSFLESKLYNFVYQIRSGVELIEKENSSYDTATTRLVVRGMGLYTAEQFKDAEFFVYSKMKNPIFSNIEVKITGPFSTSTKITVSKHILTEDKNDNQGHLVNRDGDISIHIELENERLRVLYKSINSGIHQISISCNGERIMGSPFYVNVLQCKEKPLVCDVENKSGLRSVYSQISSTFVYNKKKLNNEVGKNTNATVISNEEFNNRKVIQLDNKNIGKLKTNPIENEQTMEISKFLKQLTNTNQKVNTTSSSPDKRMNNSFFIKNNYSCFQKLIDSSFRKSCRITRKSPSIFRAHYAQFSNASPICSIHIVPEDYRKLSVDEKRQQFALQKSANISSDADLHKGSSVSINENREEAMKPKSSIDTENDQYPKTIQSKVSENSKQYNDISNVKRRKNVQEKMLFWESAFRETNNNNNNNINTHTCNDQYSSKIVEKIRQTNRADSIHLMGQKSKSLGDLKNIGKRKLNSQKFLDANLDHCCNVSLEDRTNTYMKNLTAFNEEKQSCSNINLQDKGLFRNMEETRTSFIKK